MSKLISALLIILSSSILFAQSTSTEMISALVGISDKPEINDSLLNISTVIVDSLMQNLYRPEYNIFIDVINLSRLPKTFGIICEKVNSAKSLNTYFKYLIQYQNILYSVADSKYEMKSLFEKNPELMLDEIDKYDNEKKKYLLEQLGIGLAAFYCFNDKYSCSKYFYDLYPSLKKSKHKISLKFLYRFLIDYD
jgi:hypothetical protein